jgi:oligopeptide transport system ATP-binding protein
MACVMRSIRATADNLESASVLRLENLSVRFSTPGGEVSAVESFSLTLKQGECVGVVGESGAGKSQAFLATMGLLAANGRVSGRATFGSTDLIGQRGADLDRIRGAHVGMVFQDPMTSLTPHIVVGDQVAEPMVRHLQLSWREARARALVLLEKAHVTDARRRMTQYPHELSGGMRQRVMIAIALSCEPELLIADEPTTALDVTIQAQVLALLAELKRERGMAMVLITHDFGAIAGIADRVAVMRNGKIVELEGVRAVMKAPRHPYTQALLRAMPRMDVPPTPDLPKETGGDDGPAVLSISRLSVRFPVHRGLFQRTQTLRAVDEVSFDLRAGEALGVVGESGCGKSTLARAGLLLLRPTGGQVVWMGRPLEDLASRQMKPLRRQLQIVFQDPLASLDPRHTIGEIVDEPLRVHRPELAAAERSRLVAEMLARVGLSSEVANRYPHEFSGGQCQRVGIARAMILKPRLLVCDEPVSALDVAIQEQIVTLLLDLKREYGMSVLFVSHNLAVVRRVCDRVLVLYLGRMMELGFSEELCANPLHPYTRDLLDCVPIPDPDIQPARLLRALWGEPPSPLNPPTGCVYRTRCPHAIEVCREQVPQWQETSGGGQVACHRWRELIDTP